LTCTVQKRQVKSMANKVFKNKDLLRLIYSFGDPSHRDFTFNLKWDLKPWPDLFLNRYMDRQQESEYYGYTLDEYLYEYSKKQIMKMLGTYRRCYCCQRHNTEKLMIYDKYIFTPPPMVFERQPSKCGCSCRKLSRIFMKHLMKLE